MALDFMLPRILWTFRSIFYRFVVGLLCRFTQLCREELVCNSSVNPVAMVRLISGVI